MRITIKKRVFKRISIAVLAVLVLIPIAYAAFLGALLDDFKVELVISNRAPTIKVSNISTTVDPISAGSAQVFISFNVTDADGIGNINASKAIVNITLGTPNSGQWRVNVSEQSGEFGTCENSTQGSNVVVNCTVIMQYYDNTSANWVINISVPDINGAVGRNDSSGDTPNVMTYNELSALSLPYAFVNFSNLNLGDANKPTSRPLTLNNTGNDNFEQINITGAALVGTTKSSENIAITSFAANTSNNTGGLGVPLSTTPQVLRETVQPAADSLANSTLDHGHTSANTDYGDTTISDKGNKSIFFFVDVPSSGLSPQLYNATWNVSVVDLP